MTTTATTARPAPTATPATVRHQPEAPSTAKPATAGAAGIPDACDRRTDGAVLAVIEAHLVCTGDLIRDSWSDMTVLSVEILPDEVAPAIAVVYQRHGGSTGRHLFHPTDSVVLVVADSAVRSR